MNEWRETILGNEVNLITGFPFKSSQYTDDMNGTCLLRGDNIAQGKLRWEGVKRWPSDDLNINPIYHLCEGDVVLAMDRPWIEAGLKFSVISRSDLPCLLVQRVACIRAGESLSPTFLRYLIANKDFTKHIIAVETGTAVPHVSASQIKEFSFQCPPLSEQKAIGDVLSSLDDKIDLLHRQNKTLEVLAETLFRQWFVEEAQEDWEEQPLKDVCGINNGYAFQSPTYTESGQKIIRTLNFSNHWIELNNLVYIPHDLAKSFEKYYLQRNDFLLVMVGASLGNFAIVTKDVLPSLQNQNMWCFRAKENIPQHYLNFVLRRLIDETLHSASGSAREFFQKGAFYELTVTIAPFSLMEKFEEIAESYFSKIEHNRAQIRILEKLRDTLLPKLMSGEVRVAV